MNVGDIVIGKHISWAGCSYHYTFGVITKQTPSNRFRVKYITKNEDKNHSQSGYVGSSKDGVRLGIKTVVYPGLITSYTGESVLVDNEGYSKEMHFKKYDPSVVYYDYSDFGD